MFVLNPDKALSEALSLLDQKYDIHKLYYPGSGFHAVPKEILGIERVVHLSLEEVDYFKKLGNGTKVKGDYRKSPFKSRYFDATLIWGIPPETALEAVDEFLRVTKEDGILIVGSSRICYMSSSFDFIQYCLNTLIERITIKGLHPEISVYKNKKRV